jgi:hypothetical protein
MRVPEDDDAAPPDPSSPPSPPFAPEDGAYQAIVSEYYGLQRAGADMLSAALITAAHLALMGLASVRQEPGTEAE